MPASLYSMKYVQEMLGRASEEILDDFKLNFLSKHPLLS